MAYSILGNPYHLDDEVCRRLKDAGCSQYQMSLDGMRETHDRMRKQGSFDETLAKIDCINRSGIRSLVMTTVSGENIAEVPEIIDIVVKHHVGLYGFARLCPTDGISDIGIEPLEYRRLLSVCDEKFSSVTGILEIDEVENERSEYKFFDDGGNLR